MLVQTLGTSLGPGDTVLDLACGDGGLAEFLPAQRYVGIDASPEMVAAGRSRGRNLLHADLNDYVPENRVEATTIFRAIYYTRDRPQFFQLVASYTERKLVFDLNPRQYRLEDIRTELRAAGFGRLQTRAFFVPQTYEVGSAVLRLLAALEHSGPLTALLLRWRFTVVCAATR
jgi:SAM-dependent methyltransferase